MLKVTNCTDCPLRNHDFENGSSCNLGCSMNLYFKYPNINRDTVYGSIDCDLEKIICSDGTIYTKPEEIEVI